MHLDDWLIQEGLTSLQFAQEIGASERAVIKWRRNERVPRPGFMRRIKGRTAGQVAEPDMLYGREEDASDSMTRNLELGA